MNEVIWAMIREYVQAEIKLAVAELRFAHWPSELKERDLEPMREQVTRMETAVREAIAEKAAFHAKQHQALKSQAHTHNEPYK